MTDRLTELVFKPRALTPREVVEFDGLMTIESRKPFPRYTTRDNGMTIDVHVPPAAAQKPAAEALQDAFKMDYAKAVRECNQLALLRKASQAELARFMQLCNRVKRGW